MSVSLLEVNNITKRFGGLQALSDVSIKPLKKGEIRGLIGPNGAGKSTLLNIINGIYQPTSGTIIFKEKNVTALKPYSITKLGVARTFQHMQLFSKMTVLDNIKVGRHCRSHVGVKGALLRNTATKIEEESIINESMEILSKFGLANIYEQFPDQLPYGLQRVLDLARAMATDPVLLLVDEPCCGMIYEEISDLKEMLRLIRREGVSILLVEHNMKMVMEICDYITVLDRGTVIAEGTPQQVSENEKVIKAYLGTTN